eukprot:TRINITY_DN7002_c0_g1_i1.p1 TRINITY_DN7002_c0_g1~~TRINITY_DN7002_c0_g1_i1.p1  ORF type:complete len:682 (-),score=218.34 TRINITY_DN7002_c0_g1_i1:80-2125(-)
MADEEELNVEDFSFEGFPTEEEIESAVITMADLETNDTLSDVERILTHTNSGLALRRLVYTASFFRVCQNSTFEEIKSMLSVIPALADDEELVVRQELCKQLENIGELLAKEFGDEGRALMKSEVLPYICELFGDSESDIRLHAGKAMVNMAKYLPLAELQQTVLYHTLQLCHNQTDEEMRISAVIQLNELAPLLGKDVCLQFVIPELKSLSNDQMFLVRKAVALSVDKIWVVLGEELALSKLLPIFKELCNDTVWGVRRACGEVVAAISKGAKLETRINHLTPIMIALCNDPSKWTQCSALQNLGAFLSTLGDDNIPDDLLKLFCSLPKKRLILSDDNCAKFCVFSLAAVIKSVRPERWRPMLRDCCKDLCENKQMNVRKTLGSSLHVIAQHIGSAQAEEDLIPILEFLLGDDDEIKLEIVENLAVFLGALGAPCREACLPLLDESWRRSRRLNWRIRAALASQLPKLAEMFSPPCTFSVVVPLLFTLLQDNITAVSEIACKGVYPLLGRFYSSSEHIVWAEEITENISTQFANGGSDEKILFCQMCKDIIANWSQVEKQHKERCHCLDSAVADEKNGEPLCQLKLFKESIVTQWLPVLFECSEHKVSNVRISALDAVMDVELPERILSDPAFKKFIETLSMDNDGVVKEMFVTFQKKKHQHIVENVIEDMNEVKVTTEK